MGTVAFGYDSEVRVQLAFLMDIIIIHVLKWFYLEEKDHN